MKKVAHQGMKERIDVDINSTPKAHFGSYLIPLI